jgi:hypothetical protein
MRHPFADERIAGYESPHISDHVGERIFGRVLIDARDEATAERLKAKADLQRLDDLRAQHEAAYIYLALAFSKVRSMPKPDSRSDTQPNRAAAELFHRAGNRFREIGHLNRASDAYSRAGYWDDPSHPMCIRSLARAKVLYTQIGQPADADRMHVLEWDARRSRGPEAKPSERDSAQALGCPKKRWKLTRLMTSALWWLWNATSRYGTSFGRWLAWLAATLAAFTAIYTLARDGFHTPTGFHWTPIITPFYFAIVTAATVGYGDITPKNGWTEAIVAANILTAYALLAFGVTILGRKAVR